MKSIITAIAIIIAGSAHAQAPITTNDGDLYLGKVQCPEGGREATLIETRDNGGGAYGCWVVNGNRIDVLWLTVVGPTGSLLKSNIRRSYPAPRYLVRGEK